MKTIPAAIVFALFASAAHAGFFERLHNNIDEGVRELCARKPDLCKRVEADQKRNANTSQDPAPKRNEPISSKSPGE
jgi:hypothetical protein